MSSRTQNAVLSDLDHSKTLHKEIKILHYRQSIVPKHQKLISLQNILVHEIVGKIGIKEKQNLRLHYSYMSIQHHVHSLVIFYVIVGLYLIHLI